MWESIFVTAVFMIFQVFFLTRWINNKEKSKVHNSWMPFRKLMLDSVVNHADELIITTNNFEKDMNYLLDNIRDKGCLDVSAKQKIIGKIDSTRTEVKESRNKFFNIVQTVGPSLQPYAAQYCNEVLWYGDGLSKSLDRAWGHIMQVSDKTIDNNESTSHPLNGVSAMLTVIKMFRDYRFSNFKTDFTQSVWKVESLHYFEPDNEFLPPEDYARALDGEKSKAELDKIPRTMPIKSFFEK